MDKETMGNKEPKKIIQPVIRMNYCSDDCVSCGENCEHNIDLTKSFWDWLKSKFNRSSGDKA